MEIPKSILKENEKFATKTSKKERRKKVMKFADLATKRLNIKETVGICLKECFNKNKKCDQCYHFSLLKEKKA